MGALFVKGLRIFSVNVTKFTVSYGKIVNGLFVKNIFAKGSILEERLP